MGRSHFKQRDMDEIISDTTAHRTRFNPHYTLKIIQTSAAQNKLGATFQQAVS